MSGEGFGHLVRRERLAQEIGLRQMAKMIGVSPTYLSKIERDEFPPPAEDKVKAIAQVIGRDSDELLARAGRVPSDLSEIIKRNPVAVAALLRTAESWHKLAKLTKGPHAEKAQENLQGLSRNAFHEWLASLTNGLNAEKAQENLQGLGSISQLPPNVFECLTGFIKLAMREWEEIAGLSKELNAEKLTAKKQQRLRRRH